MNAISKIGLSYVWKNEYTTEEKIEQIAKTLNELIEEHNSKC